MKSRAFKIMLSLSVVLVGACDKVQAVYSSLKPNEIVCNGIAGKFDNAATASASTLTPEVIIALSQKVAEQVLQNLNSTFIKGSRNDNDFIKGVDSTTLLLSLRHDLEKTDLMSLDTQSVGDLKPTNEVKSFYPTIIVKDAWDKTSYSGSIGLQIRFERELNELTQSNDQIKVTVTYDPEETTGPSLRIFKEGVGFPIVDILGTKVSEIK